MRKKKTPDQIITKAFLPSKKQVEITINALYKQLDTLEHRIQHNIEPNIIRSMSLTPSEIQSFINRIKHYGCLIEAKQLQQRFDDIIFGWKEIGKKQEEPEEVH